jgi:hypothetical protein
VRGGREEERRTHERPANDVPSFSRRSKNAPLLFKKLNVINYNLCTLC